MKWWRELVEHFGFGPKRKPRRGRCACGHIWKVHTSRGCSSKDSNTAFDPPTACRCVLDRKGNHARRALAAVKEAV